MSDPEVTSVDPTVLIDRASQGSAKPTPKAAVPSPATGSEVVSVDPTDLIDRASQSEAPEPVEPTILVQREAPVRRPNPAPPARPAPAYHRREPEPSAVEPTVLITPTRREPQTSQRPGPSRSPAGPSLWARLTSPRPRPAPRTPAPRGGDRWSPTTRGVLLALAAVAVMGLLVLAIYAATRWLAPTGKLLTITKPEHGTIVGNGIECGTDGSTCSTTLSDNQLVELRALTDDGYLFKGWTGPCSPSGRVLMSEARTCGATFEATPVAPPAVVFSLTIEKPTGGTITFAPDIACGSIDSRCTASVQSGSLVKLDTLPDAGFKLLHFTGDCAPDGVTTMSVARTCGATFGQAAAAALPTGPRSGGGDHAASNTGPHIVQVDKPNPQPVAGPSTPPPAQNPAPAPPQVVPGPPVVKPDDVKPETAEEHAQKEIKRLVSQYCNALQTLDAAKVQQLFSNVDQGVLKDRFRQYKSLQCEITAPPEFNRLDASDAGGAEVKFGMKQVIQMRSGGAPLTVETVVTMVTSRMKYKSDWKIDRVDHVAKPKP
jgi:hypothetical protein